MITLEMNKSSKRNIEDSNKRGQKYLIRLILKNRINNMIMRIHPIVIY